jgi:hypothetical protein
VDWHIEVEIACTAPVDDATLDGLLAALAPWHAGAISLPPGPENRWLTTITVEADSAPGAVTALTGILVDVWAKVPAAEGPIVGLEVCDDTTFANRENARRVPQLVGAAEVARLLGVSKQRLHQILSGEDRDPSPPKPVARLAGGSVWRKADWSLFLDTWPRRSGRPPKAPS